MGKNQSLIEISKVKKYFPIRGGIISKTIAQIYAVDGVSFSILEGETFGLVGESGCGKTTLGRIILGLERPSEGEVLFKGRDIFKAPEDELRQIRMKMGAIFQDPHLSLDPRMRVASIINEPLEIQRASQSEKQEALSKMLRTVRLDPSYVNRFPHELSGGEKQRVAIARALITNPDFLLADEPVSAIDVSIRSQILNLVKDLVKELGLTCLFISHDLSVIEYMCNRVGVMYLGKFVEQAPIDKLFDNPQHPYTEALLSAIPIPGESSRRRIILKGVVPSPINPPSGCRFHTRCPYALDTCKVEEPQLLTVEKDHLVACHQRSKS
jgi:oligopeptide/dipeptide ABC transporter ATP-binding protein